VGLDGDPFRVLDEPAAILLGNALRVNITLTSAAFKWMHTFSDAAAAAALLGALVAHPSLRKLDISSNFKAGGHTPAAVAAAGAALGAMVAANAPALRELRMKAFNLARAGPAGGRAAGQHAPARA
jgi:hypothetical protein